jgi:hypothetical protein
VGFGVKPLPIDIASVAHNADVDEARTVVDRVDNPVVSDPDSP